MKKKTKIQILREVAKAYTREARAVVEGEAGGVHTYHCMYSTSGKSPEKGPTRCCGVGRFFDPEKAPDWIWSFRGAVATMSLELKEEGMSLTDVFKKEVAHIKRPSFWLDVQRLHDTHINWNDKGLNSSGKRQLECLIRKWGGNYE